MLRIHEIRRNAEQSRDCLPQKIEKKIGLPKGSISDWRVVRESIDARDKKQVVWVCSVDFSVKEIDEAQVMKRGKKRRLSIAKTPCEDYVLLTKRKDYKAPKERLSHRPVVVGFGPCGMFCALILAQMGYAPIVLERGRSIKERARDVERYWKEGILDPESNVQFGEGGAGTFSDGKLTTQIKDVRIHKVIEEMIAAGGGEDLRYKQKPHVGTDVLRRVVTNIRQEILRLGGEVFFETKLTGLKIKEDRLKGVFVTAAQGEETFLSAEALVLALGHSARDTFRMLYEEGLLLQQKPFSMGVRIEHPQELINRSQYGETKAQGLPAAEYKLSFRCGSGRGVYTFCMCPGGRVIASASEPKTVVTNGMSYRSRDLENANSGLLVDVRPEDFGSSHPLAGMEFQRYWEEKAYRAGGGEGKAPAQRVEDFLSRRPTSQEDGEKNSITPSYQPGVRWTELDQCLPEFVCESLREALPQLGRRLKGFDGPDSVMSGIETRSSSPVRIRRNEDFQAQGCKKEAYFGIFPAGEGAGYAGGITSAAVDGIRIAEQLARMWRPAEKEKRDE